MYGVQGNGRPGIRNNFEAAKQFFFEGLHSLQSNNLQAAETQFARSLEFIPERVSTLNNLSTVKIRLSKFGEAEHLARQAVGLDAKSSEGWSNLATALMASERQEEALDACERALKCNAAYAMAWLAKSIAFRKLERLDEAQMACDEALRLEPGKYEFLYQKSLVLKELGQMEEARRVYWTALETRVETSPIFVGERCATQKAEVLILTRNPDISDDSFESFENLNRFCTNFPGQLGSHLYEDFHFNYVFIGDALKPEIRKQIPQPNIVLNNDVNGHVLVSEGRLARLNELVDSFGVAVVNHPSKAVATIRDLAARSLKGIDKVKVPRTTRFSRDRKSVEKMAEDIEAQYAYPLITRALGSQEGKGMIKVDSHDALLKVLLAVDCPENFFVTEFVDCRERDEIFRKIRAAVVGNEIILMRVDYDTFWNVHGRKNKKRVPFYLERPHLLDEEKRICGDPDAALGPSVMQSLRAIRERIPLDVFGIDFAVDAQGTVIFYEANATMNLFSTAPKEVANPKESGERLNHAFQSYFVSLLGKS
jgi:tetratricopeptide (TPR) repeat protein